MSEHLDRRRFLASAAAAGSAAVVGGTSRVAAAAESSATLHSPSASGRRIYKSLKIGMVKEPNLSLTDKFKLVRDLGFDGIELMAPGMNVKEVRKAIDASGLPVEGTVDSLHWRVRLSDPSPEVQEKSYEALLGAIRETHEVGGHSVLLVPGKVTDPNNENQQQVWERSLKHIRRALPLCAELGVFIAIENVWNGFNYIHEGPSDQTAELFVKYIDVINSPWVAMHFDIGNHQKYGSPAAWIRQLGGRRIVKLDVKDWGGPNQKFTKIGEGDVDWPDVRKALDEIGYTGWAAAEVAGGGRERLAEVSRNMDKYLLGL